MNEKFLQKTFLIIIILQFISGLIISKLYPEKVFQKKESVVEDSLPHYTEFYFDEEYYVYE